MKEKSSSKEPQNQSRFLKMLSTSRIGRHFILENQRAIERSTAEDKISEEASRQEAAVREAEELDNLTQSALKDMVSY